MQPKLLLEAKDWMTRAERDLGMAHRLLDGLPSYGDGAVYHAQQAAEKALKAFLTAHGRTFVKTHDLSRLLPDCIAINGSMIVFTRSVLVLSPYAAEYRYPGGDIEPDDVTARDAITMASEIVEFVRQTLFPGPP